MERMEEGRQDCIRHSARRTAQAARPNIQGFRKVSKPDAPTPLAMAFQPVDGEGRYSTLEADHHVLHSH